MSVLHWISCRGCDRTLVDVRVDPENLPKCGVCGDEMRINWEHGRPPATDVHGTPRYSDAAGRSFGSTREKTEFMKDPRNNPWGISWEAAGDKVGGARQENKITRTGYSYAGQGSRTSTGERTRAKA